jgi:hypothetical protein
MRNVPRRRLKWFRAVPATVVLATLGVVAAAAGATAPTTAAETPAPSSAGREQVALEAAATALRLVKPARSWTRLPGVPRRERGLVGSGATEDDDLSREERGKLERRATLWVTRSAPRAILAYVGSHLPRDAIARGESSSGTAHAPPGPPGPNTSREIERNYKPDLWSEEFTVPPVSDVLRRQAVTVFVAKATGGRFVIRLEGSAVWEGVRPSYSFLGADVHLITITNTFPASSHVGPSPAVVSNPSLVQGLVALVNAIPIFEDKGAVFSCPTEKPGETSGTFAVTFTEQPGAPVLAKLEGEPYACGDSFLPIITVPGHPPLELDVEPALVSTINRIAGLRLPNG